MPLFPGQESFICLAFPQRTERIYRQLGKGLRRDEDVLVDGELVNPRLHIAMHQVVAKQLLADDPPETWQAVQRLSGLACDWHIVMHMIAALVSNDIFQP
jgi:hypothetical protein